MKWDTLSGVPWEQVIGMVMLDRTIIPAGSKDAGR